MLDLLIIVFFAVIVLSPAAVAWVTQDEASHLAPAARPRRVKAARTSRRTASSTHSSQPSATAPLQRVPAAVKTATARQILVHTRTSGVVRAQTRRW
jgi:hypothetical protein